MFSCPCPWSDLPLLESQLHLFLLESHHCNAQEWEGCTKKYRHSHYFFKMPFQCFLTGIAVKLTLIFPEGVRAPWTCLCPSNTVFCGDALRHDSWVMTVWRRTADWPPWTQSAQTKHFPISLRKKKKEATKILHNLAYWRDRVKREEMKAWLFRHSDNNGSLIPPDVFGLTLSF